MDIPRLPERYQRMLSPRGFCELVLEELQKARKLNPKVKKSDVFDDLNDEFLRCFGRRRYPDIDTYRTIAKRYGLNGS